MLSRFFLKPSNLRLVTLISSKSNPQIFSSIIRPFSTNNNSGGDDNRRDGLWNFNGVNDDKFDVFSSGDSLVSSGVSGSSSISEEGKWVNSNEVEEHKPWNLKEEENDVVFDSVPEVPYDLEASLQMAEEERVKKEVIEKEEKELLEVIKGPDRAFGDLIAKSGITDEMLDSLIALKDFQGVEGLPPLTEIESLRREKSSMKSARAEIELQMQEEIAKSRVRQVDENGRAYGTGRRKCSIARVWIEPGEGKFLVNEKEFDVYFPMLDHRAALLRPLAETKTLGRWDIKCTVKGGGTTGQVGAIQLGISRALQNWEPDMRTPLRSAGFLTRDSRVVERKKPGKAKARKSFQWVKR